MQSYKACTRGDYGNLKADDQGYPNLWYHTRGC